jgi:hypothetical protein
MNAAILAFDICMDNRNMLIHALYEGTDAATNTIMLSKKARNDPLRQLKFELPLADLRRTAEEMGETVNFMIEMYGVLRWRKKTLYFDPRPAPPGPLPDIRPRPSRLTIPQRPASPGSAPPPPQPSGA